MLLRTASAVEEAWGADGSEFAEAFEAFLGGWYGDVEVEGEGEGVV